MILSKRRWLFIYVVYLDVLVLQNLLLDLASLLTLGIWQKKRVCWYRIFPAAVVGCVLGSAMFLCVHQFYIYVMGIALLVNPCMLWIAYGKKNPKECFVCYFYLILIYWVLGGVASLLLLYLPERMEKICLPLIMASKKATPSATSCIFRLWSCGKDGCTCGHRKFIAGSI